MTFVFIAGSISIKQLDPLFITRIENIARAEMNVLVADADGADTDIQNHLLRLAVRNVTVFCSGSTPRKNIGNWTVEQVHSSARPGTRAFYTTRDIAMASRADFGLMAWNGSSPGTLANILELLSRSKKTVVFINPQKRFINVKNHDDLLNLISVMSDDARAAADRKINLTARLATLISRPVVRSRMKVSSLPGRNTPTKVV